MRNINGPNLLPWGTEWFCVLKLDELIKVNGTLGPVLLLSRDMKHTKI